MSKSVFAAFVFDPRMDKSKTISVYVAGIELNVTDDAVLLNVCEAIGSNVLATMHPRL
jgi:hypothetical protein